MVEKTEVIDGEVHVRLEEKDYLSRNKQLVQNYLYDLQTNLELSKKKRE